MSDRKRGRDNMAYVYIKVPSEFLEKKRKCLPSRAKSQNCPLQCRASLALILNFPLKHFPQLTWN